MKGKTKPKAGSRSISRLEKGAADVQTPNDPAWPANTVERWPLGRLRPYARNARKHPPKQIEQIRHAMRAYGWTVPILAREDGTIIAGHARYEAGKAEGYAEAPVIVARGWSEEQCRAYALADNRIALNSAWDEDTLRLELGELAALGVDLEPLGFELHEIGRLVGSKAGLTDPDDVPEAPANPVSRTGDLWVLGRHRLLCGDSTKKEDADRVLAGVKPHLMVTDPPYGVSYDASWRNEAAAKGFIGQKKSTRAVGKVANDDRADWRKAWKLFAGDVAYVWHAGNMAHIVAESLIAAGFAIRAQIVWAKNNMVISRGHYHPQHEPLFYAVKDTRTGHWSGDRKQTTLWQINKNMKSETGHSTQKPVECMKRPMENNSSPGQAVYDPFLGSGTTIIAAEMTGRSCHAIELDPIYVDVCIKRWQDFAGHKATLDGDRRSFDEVAAERMKKAA